MNTGSIFALLERTPKSLRWELVHRAAVGSIATREPQATDALLGALADHPARPAYENLVWEASFCRDTGKVVTVA